ncbi:DUF6064 family protein [Salegentibacter flavus]|uniref:Uncharacterized protein n=1 Tax=Salegentibacter flavus TaxID=287099 RepID=A0A1I5BZI3_9FLAO|nr:DUF6064 family protein [Salegentibacter flavus]SFN80150.1 hypothetical protein SAMN05660413_02624 [Salegentibacter flavus]
MKIPFTTEQFFEIIEKYNLAVFPVQLIILLLGILSVIILHSNINSKNKLIGGFLGVLWIWIGIAYHFTFFTEINKAAYVFGGFFVLQGLIFLIETFSRKKLEFEFNGKITDYIAYFFIVFAIVIYPVLIYFLENSLEKIITLGLPCPSTILTFGFLMLTKPKLSKYIVTIPVLWTIVGTSAAFNFGVYPDYIMALSALTAFIYLVTRKKE